MLRQAGGSASRLELVKWAFLVSRETSSAGGPSFYQFVPYRHGPYSFTLDHEATTLLHNGWLEEPNERTWKLSDYARNTGFHLPSILCHDVTRVVCAYGRMPVDELIDSIYSRYPWFTVNAAATSKKRQRRPVAPPAVYTIGYEGLLIDSFLDALMRNGIWCLIDVRNNPVSRVYGLHQTRLRQLCAYLQIEYRHLPELGISPARREGLHHQSEYEALLSFYERSILPRERQSVEHLAQAMRGTPAALVCYEADPSRCHRSRLAAAVGRLTDLPVIHLEWPRQ